MDANFIINSIARKYNDSALVKEIVIDAPSDPVANKIALDRALNYGKDSDYYKGLLEFLKNEEVAETIPEDWTPLPTKRRIDGLLYKSQKLIAIEVKVSLADFKRETEDKRKPWEKVTHQFVYATPKGLLDIRQVPPHCGLWEVEESGNITVVKRAKVNKNPDPMPQQVLVSLMFRNRLNPRILKK